MRVTCPCGCGHRFDVPIRQVLAEAERLAEKRKRKEPPRPVCSRCHKEIQPGQEYVVGRRITDGKIFSYLHSRPEDCPFSAEPNGNVLSPHDLAAKKQRKAVLEGYLMKPGVAPPAGPKAGSATDLHLPRCEKCGGPLEHLRYNPNLKLIKKICDKCEGNEPNGNVLSPHDLEAKKQRDEAVRKRLGQKNL